MTTATGTINDYMFRLRDLAGSSGTGSNWRHCASAKACRQLLILSFSPNRAVRLRTDCKHVGQAYRYLLKLFPLSLTMIIPSTTAP